jgi:Outer membrane protein beta-barrel family/Carboxypeptidase regulatory-like domain
MRRFLILVLVFGSITNTSFAQSGSIKGKIIGLSDNKPIPNASVALFYKKDTVSYKTIASNLTGNFVFNNLPVDSFILKITNINFETFFSNLRVDDATSMELNITLTPKKQNLDEVIVKSKGTPVIQKGDTIQYSASQYKVNPDATTEDLLKKIPGVTVAKDGTVTAQGETVKKVTIDGKDYFGDDASAALKNVQSDMVDKIQVFDRMSDQSRLTGFDDGNSVKAINIVTKAGFKSGNLGRIYAGAGSDSRYNVGGNTTFLKNNRRLSIVGTFNNINAQNFSAQDLLGATSGSGGNGGGGNRGGGPPGGGGRPGGMGGGNDFGVAQANGISQTNAIGFNYTNKFGKKVDVSGSYFFNQSKNENATNINTETFTKPDTSFFTTQRTVVPVVTNNINHRINMRLEYTIDSANSIFIIPSLSFQNTDTRSNNIVQNIFTNVGATKFFDTANTSNSTNTSVRDGYNLRNSILYRHAFAKKGRSISFGLNNSFTKNNADNIVDANFRYFKNGLLVKDSLQKQQAENVSTSVGTSGTIAYTEPLTKKAQLQFDYNPSVQKSNADQQTFGYDGSKYNKFEPLLSNKFDNVITTHNAGITYRLIPGKEEMFQAGLSFQTTNLKSDRVFPTATNVQASFSNVLGNLILRKKFNAKSSIRVFYRGGTNFPSVSQLQDVVSLANPLRASVGNTQLSQSYTNFLGSRYAYTNSKTSKSFFVGNFIQVANDYISNATFIPTKDSAIQNGIVLRQGSQLTKPVNLNGFMFWRAFSTYSFPIKYIKSVLNLNASFIYQRLPTLINSTKITTKSTVYNTGFTLASNISEYVDFNISYAANFGKATGNNTVTNYVNQNAGLQINLLNKKGWFVQNDINYQINSGLSAGFNQNFGLWNAAVGKKFLKNNTAELKLSVYDLLKQNQSITRNVYSGYVEDVQSVVLQQYFMLTFTYSLKNFGKAAKPTAKPDNKEEINRLLPRTYGGGF